MEAPDAILINRDGQQYGPYTVEQARMYLASGNLAPTDWAWDEGKSTWVPLSQIAGIGVSTPAPPSTSRPRAPRQRRPVVLVIMALLWWGVLMVLGFILISFVAAFMAGILHPDMSLDARREAGPQAGAFFEVPVMLGSLALSTWLTVIGVLPGTRK